MAEIADDKESEYAPIETESISIILEQIEQKPIPKWTGIIEPQAMTISPATERPIPQRNPQRAADALYHANYTCEFNSSDRTFLRKNGKPYTEPHHLIPISKYRDFSPNSVDVLENIVSLCSHCHNLLHYGQIDDKRNILEKLYKDRKEALDNIGLSISFEQLLSYYT